MPANPALNGGILGPFPHPARQATLKWRECSDANHFFVKAVVQPDVLTRPKPKPKLHPRTP